MVSGTFLQGSRLPPLLTGGNSKICGGQWCLRREAPARREKTEKIVELRSAMQHIAYKGVTSLEAASTDIHIHLCIANTRIYLLTSRFENALIQALAIQR